jgi:WD40 repeat protein
MEQFIKNNDLLLSVLEFLDRNGFKQSFEKLQQKTGVYYKDNDIKIIKDLLHSRKIDELIIFIRNNSNIKNEEKMEYIKVLKIKKYIYLIINNCYDRIDQKDSLYYLRTEIAPMISNTIDKNLLSLLTSLLFYKDMNLLKDYIKKNLKIYSDDSYIISKLSQNRIIPIEKLYDIYNNYSENKKEISFEKYNVITIKDLCFNPFKSSEIWFLEISKNKKYIALGFSNCNISLISVIYKNNKINLNLYLTFSSNENSKKGEITSLNFSNDEKYLLVSLTSSIKIFNVLNGEKIKEYNNLHNSIISSCLYISNSNTKFISGSIDKKLLLIDINTNEPPFLEIGKFCRIKQLLYSEFNNLIVIIPGSLNDIICYDLSKNKISYKIEIKKEIVYSNISKNDKGKYILINISKTDPKISLYNLGNSKIEGNYYGHTQKTMIIKCSFAGDKDQYIISGSEDSNVYLWDRNIPGRPKYIFKEHLGIVNSVELLFNDVLLSASDDKSLKIWISKNDENGDVREIIYNKNEKNILKIVGNNFEKEFFERMNEPLEEIQAEEENVEESDEEEERIGEIRYEGID